jgi:hypothetical protein
LVIDAPLASVAANIDVLSIMPSDGMIVVKGNYDGKPASGIIFLRTKDLLNAEWLASHVSR